VAESRMSFMSASHPDDSKNRVSALADSIVSLEGKEDSVKASSVIVAKSPAKANKRTVIFQRRRGSFPAALGLGRPGVDYDPDEPENAAGRETSELARRDEDLERGVVSRFTYHVSRRTNISSITKFISRNGKIILLFNGHILISNTIDSRTSNVVIGFVCSKLNMCTHLSTATQGFDIAHHGSIHDACFSGTEVRVASAGGDGLIKVR